MRLKVNWYQTGDALLFDICNEKLAVWFVETSLEKGNKFIIGDQIIDEFKTPANVQRYIIEETQYVDTVNEIFKKLKIPQIEKPTDWYDQKQLNKLHKDWAQTRIKWPKLTELLYKLDKRYFDAYQEMNCHIHLIEKSFNYSFRDTTNWRVENPFKNEFFPWESSHLYLNYPGHGRFSFEKFINNDVYDDMWVDDCNWDNIDAYLGVNLRRPYKKTIPPEFLLWCEEKKLIPTESTIAIGNLVNWENNLASARRIFEENMKISENYFSLSLTS